MKLRIMMVMGLMSGWVVAENDISYTIGSTLHTAGNILNLPGASLVTHEVASRLSQPDQSGRYKPSMISAFAHVVANPWTPMYLHGLGAASQTFASSSKYPDATGWWLSSLAFVKEFASQTIASHGKSYLYRGLAGAFTSGTIIKLRLDSWVQTTLNTNFNFQRFYKNSQGEIIVSLIALTAGQGINKFLDHYYQTELKQAQESQQTRNKSTDRLAAQPAEGQPVC